MMPSPASGPVADPETGWGGGEPVLIKVIIYVTGHQPRNICGALCILPAARMCGGPPQRPGSLAYACSCCSELCESTDTPLQPGFTEA